MPVRHTPPMAIHTRTITDLHDDLDERITEGVQTYSFGYQGKSYEIELGEKNAAKLEKALAPFIAAARTAGGTTRSSSRGRAKSGGGRRDLADVRAWAAANGYNVSPRGRVAGSVLEAYDAAQGGK